MQCLRMGGGIRNDRCRVDTGQKNLAAIAGLTLCNDVAEFDVPADGHVRRGVRVGKRIENRGSVIPSEGG